MRRARLSPREELTQRLREAGYDVWPDMLLTASGSSRALMRWDDQIVSWEAWARRIGEENGRMYRLVSYDTMTDCARPGVTLGEPDGMLVWVYAKDRTVRKTD